MSIELAAPTLLTAAHRLDAFDCGKPALNQWLQRHARQAQNSGSAKTFVTAAADGEVFGYFSLTVGQVDALDAPERVRKGMGHYPIPVMILARLAVALRRQGSGVGGGLLQDAVTRTLAIAELAGIRTLLTHPIDAGAAGFYRHHGFTASPLHERQLLMPLKNARRVQERLHQTVHEDPPGSVR